MIKRKKEFEIMNETLDVEDYETALCMAYEFGWIGNRPE